jgi:hypothetical protein
MRYVLFAKNASYKKQTFLRVISIPPAGCIDLNRYCDGRKPFSPKVNLPGSSAVVEQ